MWSTLWNSTRDISPKWHWWHAFKSKFIFNSRDMISIVKSFFNGIDIMSYICTWIHFKTKHIFFIFSFRPKTNFIVCLLLCTVITIKQRTIFFFVLFLSFLYSILSRFTYAVQYLFHFFLFFFLSSERVECILWFMVSSLINFLHQQNMNARKFSLILTWCFIQLAHPHQ